MNKLLAPSLLLGLLAGATAQAQTTPAKIQVKKDERRTKADDSEQPDASRGSRGPGNRLAEMTNGLNLTSEQQTNVAAIWQEQVQQMHALRGTGGTEDRAARMQQLRALQESTEAKLKTMLTSGQFQQYQARKPQQRQRMGPPPGGPTDLSLQRWATRTLPDG